MKIFIIILFSLLPIFVVAQQITTIAGNGILGYSGDNGEATNATIGFPGQVICDRLGNIYFSENNSTVRKVNSSGVISTVAGNGTTGYSGDLTQATNAQLNMPASGGVAVDNLGNLYIADQNNHRIRKVNSATHIITTYAGNGSPGYSGDGGEATVALLNNPIYICIDNSDNLYIAANLDYVIRKVSPPGIITTIAGNGTPGYSGDGGQATNAQLHGPGGLHTDATGNLYFPDYGRIRKIDIVTGIITTIAGGGNYGFSGDNGPATAAVFSIPQNVVADANGNLYISDVDNNRIRKININGIITTVVGNGISGYNGDIGEADTSEISSPRGIALDTCGNLFISDNGNHRIRKVTFDTTCGKPDTSHTDTSTIVNNINAIDRISIYPNPATDKIMIAANNITNVQLMNMLGQMVFRKEYNSTQTSHHNKVEVSMAGLAKGIYFVRVNNEYMQKVVKE